MNVLLLGCHAVAAKALYRVRCSRLFRQLQLLSRIEFPLYRLDGLIKLLLGLPLSLSHLHEVAEFGLARKLPPTATYKSVEVVK